ncbi:TspO/MBR related protein [Rhizobium subbaraonis]|uniref:TspO/MBR related protein n=1 Tax=Rhizobium subbaraonis TaxID=908946 RepID=A0A285UR66_9HYPH|nr:TspO/MBR family protein [Rhizobium subbaraonis]SOC44364.1 TspO/MBR related protein [Rhizobium subbaraonis]
MNSKALTYLSFLVLVVGGGLLIGLFNLPDAWYRSLAKPAFNPPDWVFGPVWTLLYAMIAVAGARTFIGFRKTSAMRIWWAALALNFAWSPLFFGLREPALALIVVIGLVVSVLLYILSSWKQDRPSALLFLPYLAWTSFAAVLNGAIVALN